MEMTKEELEVRLLSQISGINSVKIEGGFLAGSDWTNLTAGLERMANLELHIDDTPSRSVSDIRAEARQLVADGGLDLLVIDYVQLMKGNETRRGMNRNEQITEIARELKVLAGELQLPVMVLSQLKRIQGRPKLDDLRESGALEQEANQVALLHRVDHREGGPTAFILAKNRNGPTGEETLTFIKECARFDDGGEPLPVESPEVEQAGERKAKRQRHFARRAAGLT
jgi:replicative DNA helicase